MRNSFTLSQTRTDQYRAEQADCALFEVTEYFVRDG